MYRRVLPHDAVLWWRGDAAETIGIVERGRVGVRAEGRLLDVVVAGACLGEAALLSLDGPPAQRTADVYALEEDTVVVEHPVSSLVTAPPEGVLPRVLRTLIGQVGRNHLLVAAAHPGHAFLGAAVVGLVEGLARWEGPAEQVRTWTDFIPAFRFLYRLREASDAARRDLAPDMARQAGTALGLLDPVRAASPDLAARLEAFVRAEDDRLSGR